jgi:hypothetical protein
MLKSNNFLLRLACVLMLQMVASLAQAQVTVANAHASSNGTYTTLKGAFDAINGQSQTGNSITITITASTTETAAAVLNAGDWTSLTMYPNATGLSISGGLSGTPLIDLNGADNVTIDGRVNATGSTVDLTITNTSTGATGTSTIRYINDASGNTVQYCLIKGASTNESAGVLFFSTAAAGGNDNNSINNNNITADVDANRPRNIIFSSGTAANENNGNSITNNNIYNFFSRSGTGSQAVMLSANTTAWVISGNSFYETASFTPTATTPYSVIYINNTSGISFRINDNYLGGSAASCGGSAWTKTGSSGVQDNTFYGIRCNVGTADSSRLYNNRIQNWSWTNSTSSAWYGIAVEGGQVNIGNSGGNRIGDTTGTGNITYTAGRFTGSAGNLYGIHISGSGNVSIRGNLMGSITATNWNTGWSSSFYGINKTVMGGTLTIRNNFIGSAATANSIRCSSPATSFTSNESTQLLYGVYSLGTGVLAIEDNSICNLTNSTSNASTGIGGLCRGVHVEGFASGSTINNNTIKTLSIASANTNQPLSGIFANNSGATITIRGNSIVGLTNTFSNYTGNFSGIYLFAINNQNSTVSQNFISNLSINSPSIVSAPNIQAIYCLSSDVIVSNNIITINNNSTTTYYGIRINSSSSSDESILFNTIYFAGSQSATVNANSRCIWMSGSSSSSTFHYVYNNLLYNARTNSGSATGTHAAVYYDFSTNVFSNYNNYFVNGTGGVVGYWPSSNRTTLADLQTANAQDAGSRNINVVFTNAGGSTAGSYLPTSAAANLVLVANRTTSVTTDYTGATRSFYSMGAYDFAVNQPLVQVTATAGTATADYTSLKLALDAINAGTHQGTVEVKIATSLSDNQSAILYQSGFNSTSSYTSLAIYPTAANLVYEASLAGVLLDLNGADNVTLDGRVNRTGSSVSLTLVNTSTSSSANTIRFINGAQSNTIRYTSVKGISAGSSATSLITFSTSTSGSNSSNTIEYCSISGLTSTSRPQHAVYSSGSASPNGNNSNTIRYNEFFNFFANDGLSFDVSAVGVYSNSSDWTISDNSFFLQSTISRFSGNYHVVYINNASGVNFQVNNNFIGGTSASCGGGTFTVTDGGDFWGIRLNVGTSTASNIQGNTIRKISWSTPSSSNALVFAPIGITAGNVNIGTTTGNVIGDSTTTNSILYSRSNTSSSVIFNFYGINILSAGTINCSNNIISGIQINNTGLTRPVNFFGIRNAPGSSNTASITNNIIGAYNTANSLNNTSVSTGNAQECYGILTTASSTINDNLVSNLNNATNNTTTTDAGRINGIRCTSGTQSIQRNTVRNLSIANASTSAAQDASVGGIVISGAGAHTLTANIITGLTNSNSSFAGNIHGLYLVGTSSASNITRNFIQGLAATGASSVSATLYGIRHISGQATYTNNIVAFGNNNPGTLYGIFDAGAASSALNLYHNTVYLGGSPASGALNSFAFYSNTALSARNHRNNVFANARSNNGASGTHYAAFFNYAVSTNLTLDFNNYFAGGTGGVLGRYNSANVTSVPLISGLDAASKNAVPLFANAGGQKPADYRSSQKEHIGVFISGITTDFANATRSYYAMGALEQLVFSQWTGNSSSVWATTTNWTSGAIPPSTTEVQFSATAGRDLILDANRTIKALYFNGASRKFVLGNFNLTVDSIITGGAASSYVQTNGTGVINKTISNSSTFEFQAGNAAYNPVGITNNTGSSDNFDVRVQDEVYNRGSSGTLLTTPRVAATWIINKTSGTSNAGNGVDFTFGFDATQKKSGLNNDNDIRLYHYGSVWTKQSAAGSISLSGSTYSYSYPQYKGSFSPFSVGDDIVLLPASWMAFGCNREEQNRTVVSWTVSDEKQVASYTVERSLNGLRYDSIGNIAAAGNVAGIQRYDFLDKNAPSTPAYYRIVQMEISGDYSLSNPCFSRPPQNKTVTAVDIYPNPANRQIVITGVDPEHTFTYTLSDIAGKTILKGYSLGGKAAVETTQVPAGVYYINIVGTGIHINRKVLINH